MNTMKHTREMKVVSQGHSSPGSLYDHARGHRSLKKSISFCFIIRQASLNCIKLIVMMKNVAWQRVKDYE